MVSAMAKDIPYLPDLEAGIRASWSLDWATGHTYRHLLEICLKTSPYLCDHPSFVELIQDVPQFAQDFAQALLGCSGSDLPFPPRPGLRDRCSEPSCKNVVERPFFHGKDLLPQNVRDLGYEFLFLIPTMSLAFGEVPHEVSCSVKCFREHMRSRIYLGAEDRQSISSVPFRREKEGSGLYVTSISQDWEGGDQWHHLVRPFRIFQLSTIRARSLHQSR